MWEQKAPNVAICFRLKAGLGAACPHTPRGRWGRKFRVEFLTVTTAFGAAQKCKRFAFWQNHITRAEALVGQGFQPRLLEVDIRARDRAREKRAEMYI